MSSVSHILIVDDEPEIRESLSYYLGNNGFKVSSAADEKQALDVIAQEHIDLVILDIVLGQDDGISICRTLRQSHSLPIMFLSGKAEDTEKVVGLEVGADDYMIKPFNPRELLARVKAILRRTQQISIETPKQNSKKYRFGDFVLDAIDQQISTEAGDAIQLSSGETRLLLVFMENPQTVLSRDFLLEATQGRMANMFERSIDNYVARLRKKIEENPKKPQILKTYWGGGYLLNCAVSPL